MAYCPLETLLRLRHNRRSLPSQALSAFGTDFTLLSQLFPGRNRRQCKNKYTKECKANARRVDEALKGNPSGSAPYEEILSRLRGETDGTVRA